MFTRRRRHRRGRRVHDGENFDFVSRKSRPVGGQCAPPAAAQVDFPAFTIGWVPRSEHSTTSKLLTMAAFLSLSSSTIL